MPTLFISDLHLDANHKSLADLFVTFLSRQARDIDALYILGDFFEMWLGDDIQNDFQKKMIDTLRNYTSLGIPTYFMVGNRDFLVGKQFASESGCILLPDPIVIDLYGKPTLLMHGDNLCSNDHLHQWYRKLSRNWLTQKCFLSLSPKIRKKLGNRIRQRSAQRSKYLPKEIMDVTPYLVQKIMRKHQVLQMIHGHTHKPSIEYFTLGDKQAKRIVLSDWNEQGNFLQYQPNGDIRLLYF